MKIILSFQNFTLKFTIFFHFLAEVQSGDLQYGFVFGRYKVQIHVGMPDITIL